MDAVKRINNDKVDEYFPAIVLYITVAVLGVLGNLVSFVYHGFCVSKTTVNFMLTALAVVDFFACLAISGNIVQLYQPVMFTSVDGCKAQAFINHWLVVTSGCAVVLVAIDRYRRVCKPFNWQFSLKSAKFVFICTTAFCFVLTARDIALFDVLQMNITTSLNATVTGFHCDYTEAKELYLVKIVFLYIDIAMFAILALVGGILYVMILRTLVKSRKIVTSYQTQEEPKSSSSEPSASTPLELSEIVSAKPEKTTYSEGENVKAVDNSTYSKQPDLNLSCVSLTRVDTVRFVGQTSHKVSINCSNVAIDKVYPGVIMEFKGDHKQSSNIKENNIPSEVSQANEHSPPNREIQTIECDTYHTAGSDKCGDRNKLNSSQCQCHDKLNRADGICDGILQQRNNEYDFIVGDASEKQKSEVDPPNKYTGGGFGSAKSSSSSSLNRNERLMTKSERQITIMTSAVVILAFISFLPTVLVYLFTNTDTVREGDHGYSLGVQIALYSYKLHNAINPYVICCFQHRFRKSIKERILIYTFR